MGSSGSKTERNLQKSGQQQHPNEKKSKIIERNYYDDDALNNKCLDEQKFEYEEQYKKLEQQHNKLQTEFLELKAKYNQDIANIGDFISHTNEVNEKLEDAFHEKNQIDSLTQTDEMPETNPTENIDEFYDNEDVIKEHVTNLEQELSRLLSENANKELEIENLEKKLENIKQKSEEEKALLKEEFTTKGLLLCERYEEEKKEMNSIWENKLTEVINNCNQDITNFRSKLFREKSALESKLEFAITELNTLEKKNKLLSNLFEDIRTRYESRESRPEDLERIADLEGQLIIQAEELEKQRDILRNVKCLGSNNNNTENLTGLSRRSKKNAKKRKKRTQLVSGQQNSGDCEGDGSPLCTADVK